MSLSLIISSNGKYLNLKIR